MKKPSPTRTLRLGTRGSPLALWQAGWVARELESANPGLSIEIVEVRTLAEEFPERAVAEIGSGVFTKELDEALLRGDIGMAVHSLKDVPSEMPSGLIIAAVPERESPFDAFVSTGGVSLAGLPRGARIGTGSPRRKAQLLHWRPDLEVVPLRGNVATRIRKAGELGLAGTILAEAGLRRLGEEGCIQEVIGPEVMVPAVSQGALALVVREDDDWTAELASSLGHTSSHIRVYAERAFLRTLRGGCQAPAGALATISQEERLEIEGVIAAPDGSTHVRGRIEGLPEDAPTLGVRLAHELLGRGGAEILRLLGRI